MLLSSSSYLEFLCWPVASLSNVAGVERRVAWLALFFIFGHEFVRRVPAKDGYVFVLLRHFFLLFLEGFDFTRGFSRHETLVLLVDGHARVVQVIAARD